MKRAKTLAGWWAVFGLAAWFALPAGAQAPTAQQPASKPAAASKKAKSTKAKGTKAESAKAESAKAESAKAEEPGTAAAAEETPVRKRDPFQPLVTKQQAAGVAPNLPPGKAGLQISTVKIDGTVRAPSGMIAVVSNPQQRVYFLHEGDRVYDGRVEKIGLDAVTFLQTEKDAFGKVIDRLVTKRIYPSAGEQQ